MSRRKELPAVLRRIAPTPPVKDDGAAQQTLSLPGSAQPERQIRAIVATRLWLCIYLPALPLEALQRGEPGASAVFEDQQGMRRLLLANREAAAAGIVPGLSVNAALALQPTLEPVERNPAKEREVLKRLAGWAERFTSLVSLEEPAALLLEIAGSLRLFGGLPGLRNRIGQGLEAEGFHATVAIAPTPLAAIWLAKAGHSACIRDTANLTGALSPLPLSCLDWPDAVYESLRGMGISSIGECLRLPRSGFTKRFGAGRLLQLDRALGRLPDPRVCYRSPERFVREYELTGEQSDAGLLLNACRRLLQDLERFLLARQLAVQNVRFSFYHLRAPATCLTLGCVRADRAVQHWFELLRIRFEQLTLPEPVIAIRLRGGRSQLCSVETGVLPFSEIAKRRRDAPIAHLVERLSARIGDASVHGVTTVAEHRPQYAWRAHYSIAEQPRVPHCEAVPVRRPLWMLSTPLPLPLAQGRPVYQGMLEFLDGPERLETGWWDDDGIARDYFVAANPQGARLWVFRDRRDKAGWYLHGIFG